MDAEGDHLVYDYLSRVADLAQSALPPGERVRLVNGLRADIDRARAGNSAPTQVRRILDRLGTPSEVIAAAGGHVGAALPKPTPQPQPTPQSQLQPQPPLKPTRPPAQPAQSTPPAEPPARRPASGLAGAAARFLGRSGGAAAPAGKENDAEADAGPAVPLDAGTSPGVLPVPAPRAAWDGVVGERGGATAAPGEATGGNDWWRIEKTGLFTSGDELAGLPGMTGGIFIPPPPPAAPPPRPAAEGEGDDAEGDEGPADGESGGGRKKRRLPFPLRRRPAPSPAAAEAAAGAAEAGARAARARWALVETLAALLLVAGAVIGSWYVLALGWLGAFWSPRLSREQAKFASMTLPGIVAGGALVWFWGRQNGKWGSPVPGGHVGQALTHDLPWIVRVAAFVCAAYLLLRARGRGGPAANAQQAKGGKAKKGKG
jgi:hypothetical protein